MPPLSDTIGGLRFAAIDFESAGAARGETDQPVQIGIAACSRLEDEPELWTSYIAVEKPVLWSASQVHGITTEMLADALKPYGGIVMWRAFVYSPTDSDRAKQAYLEFMPLDGQFRENVIVQIKNGPIDFQPREPYSPLFTAMKQTPMMVEFQITQEYLGFSNHLA